MRIIIVNDNATINGGAAKVALISAQELSRLGHQVEFVSGSSEHDSAWFRDNQIQFHSLGRDDQSMNARRLMEVAYLQSVEQFFRSLLAKADPKQTIVHLHCWKTGVSPSVLSACEAAKVPFVVTFHDYHVACPQGQFFNKQTHQICNLQPGSLPCIFEHCTESRTMVSKWAEIYRHKVQVGKGGIPSRLRHAILLSAGTERIIRPYLPGTCQIHHVANPIDIDQRNRVAAESNSTIVFAGRLSPEKDPMTLLKAASSLELPVHFVGDGPLRSELEATSYPKAQFLGWRSPAGVAELLTQARAFVLPSIWYEVKPLAPLEAMALGIPVIVSDCTTTAEELRNGENGLVFQRGSVESLAEQLSKLSDNNFVQQLSTTGYEEYWANPPTPQRHVEELMDCYQQMIA